MSRRRTRRASVPRRLLHLALFLLAVLVGSSFVRITLQDHALAREAAGVRAEIAIFEVQQAALRAEVALRQTDGYVEQKARELGYVKPGEGLAAVRDAPRASPNAGKTPTTTSTRFQRWLALFFHP